MNLTTHKHTRAGNFLRTSAIPEPPSWKFRFLTSQLHKWETNCLGILNYRKRGLLHTVQCSILLLLLLFLRFRHIILWICVLISNYYHYQAIIIIIIHLLLLYLIFFCFAKLESHFDKLLGVIFVKVFFEILFCWFLFFLNASIILFSLILCVNVWIYIKFFLFLSHQLFLLLF